MAERNKRNMPDDHSELRLRADSKHTCHELQAHQIELEMQNNEMHSVQRALELSREQYFNLYDMQPVGCLLLNKTGMILEANLSAATFLGQERNDLIGQPLALFIYREDQDVYYRCHQQLVKTQAQQMCELRMVMKYNNIIWVCVNLSMADGIDAPTRCGAVIVDITRRKKFGEGLLESEERYRRLFEVESDSVFLVDCETGQFLEANTAALTLYGYTKAEFLALNIADVSAEPDKTRRAIAERETNVPLRWHSKKDGTVFPVEIAGSYFESQGHGLHVAAIRDISKRIHTETALRQSEERLNLALAASKMGVWEWDLCTNAVVCSPEVINIFGRESFNPTVEFFIKAIHPDDADRVMASAEQAVATKEDYKSEFRIIGPSGEVRWISNYGRPRYDENGKPLRLVGTAQDITDRKKDEEALKESEELLKRVLDTLPIGIWIVDKEGKVKQSNPAAQRIWGFYEDMGVDQYKMRKAWRFDTGRQLESHEWATARAIGDKQTILNEELEIESFDGIRKIILNSAVPIVNAKKEVVGAIAVNQDITRRKETENRDNVISTLLSVFSKTISHKEYCEAIVELVRQWSGCRCVGLRILDIHGNIPYESYRGFSREFWEFENMLSMEKDSCACIRVITGKSESQDLPVMTKGGSFYSNDTLSYVGGMTEEEKKRFRGTCLRYGLSSLAVVPIRYRDNTLGAFHLADEKKGKVTLKVVEFMEMIAPLVGEAIYRFRLEEQLQQKYKELRRLSAHVQDAREEEKRKITRELHDQLAQNLTVLGINLNSLKTEMPGSDRVAHIESSLLLLEQMTESVRDLMAGLRPPLLDEYGLGAALKWYVEQFAARTGIIVNLDIHNLHKQLDPHIENTLFRITQEALNNVAKHAQATYAWVELEIETEMKHPVVRLTISDNGVGFVPMKTQKHGRKLGLGILTMTERAEGIGGTCRIESPAGKGTIVTVEAML